MPQETEYSFSAEVWKRYRRSFSAMLGLCFILLLVLMLTIGMFKPLPAPRTAPSVNAVDMTPWKPAPYLALVLFIIVISTYVIVEIF